MLGALLGDLGALHSALDVMMNRGGEQTKNVETKLLSGDTLGTQWNLSEPLVALPGPLGADGKPREAA